MKRKSLIKDVNIRLVIRHGSGILRSVAGLIVMAALSLLAQTGSVFGIIDGYNDGTAHPYVGAVDIRLAGAPIVASGTLISPTVLVTAGHVTRFFDRAGQTWARVTFDPVADETSTWYWGRVHTDPAYASVERQDDPNDLGVIVFNAPIPGITPALLPTKNFTDQFRGGGRKLPVFDDVGFGTTTHIGGASSHGLYSFVGDGTRKFARSQFSAVENGWLYTSSLDGHVCYGDSGGPALLGNIVLAIHKAGANLNFCTGDDFDMRLDSADHRTFLGQYVMLP